jgi:uncharacterized membrane protein YgcG
MEEATPARTNPWRRQDFTYRIPFRTRPVEIPNPAGPTTQGPPPPQIPAAAGGNHHLSDGDLTSLRALLPNLSGMSDAFLRSSSTATLLQLNAAQAGGGGASPAFDFSIAAAQVAAAAVAAAQQNPSGGTANDPSVKMFKNLENIRNNPTKIDAGTDDRVSTLHSARFLGGMVCTTKKIWKTAREHIPLEGIDPLATYDFSSVGLGGCITPRGILELHNPASQSLSLKMFTAANMTSSSVSRRLTLVDGDSAINVGDNLKDIINLEAFIHAMRALCEAARFICPWNFSFPALNGFLLASNYAAKDLAGNKDRVPILVEFVNHVFKLNANAWIQREDFLTAGELKNTWDEFFANQPAHLLTAGGGDGGNNNQNSNQQNQNPTYNNQYKNWRGGRGRGRGGYFGGQGGQGGGGAGGQSFQSSASNQQQTPNTSVPPPPTQHMPVCMRFNRGVCPNNANNCTLPPSGHKALHVCNVTKSNGAMCRGAHSRLQHH